MVHDKSFKIKKSLIKDKVRPRWPVAESRLRDRIPLKNRRIGIARNKADIKFVTQISLFGNMYRKSLSNFILFRLKAKRRAFK